MRNLVVCSDGTWNTPDQEDDGVPVPTNVVRIFNCIADEDASGQPQLTYYHPGLGTEGNWWDKLKGGSVGGGLGRNIMSAYRWLGGNYQEADRLFLFGFSRGAYTVRSLGGMLSRCGLLDLRDLEEAEVWQRVEAAYHQGYRENRGRRHWAGDWAFLPGAAHDNHVDIHFIGVWDTVGALGIPNDLAILNLFDDRSRHLFHNPRLGAKIRYARHAVALDEIRASFTPTLWQEDGSGTDLKQVWFAGVHADVGGGYAESGLSNCALEWMIGEARGAGLGFRPEMVKQVRPDFQDVLHDSRRGVFSLLKSQPRSVPRIDRTAGVHASVGRRSKEPPISQAPYRATRTLRRGQSASFRVFADQPWNTTYLYLDEGARYRFTARGEWLDSSVKCGPGGTRDEHFQPGEIAHILGTVWGKAEKLFKRITYNDEAEFKGTRRHEEYPWFALVGVIANGDNPMADGTPAPHQSFLIGAEGQRSPRKPGYLYCFANDAWNFYGNNRGSVELTVTREA